MATMWHGNVPELLARHEPTVHVTNDPGDSIRIYPEAGVAGVAVFVNRSGSIEPYAVPLPFLEEALNTLFLLQERQKRAPHIKVVEPPTRYGGPKEMPSDEQA